MKPKTKNRINYSNLRQRMNARDSYLNPTLNPTLNSKQIARSATSKKICRRTSKKSKQIARTHTWILPWILDIMDSEELRKRERIPHRPHGVSSRRVDLWWWRGAAAEGRGRRLVAHEVGQLRRGPGGAVRPAAEGRGRVAGLSRSSWDGSGEVRRLRGTGDVGEGPRRGDRVGRRSG